MVEEKRKETAKHEQSAVSLSYSSEAKGSNQIYVLRRSETCHRGMVSIGCIYADLIAGTMIH